MTLVDPESIAFGSVDDGVAEKVARAMGWRGETQWGYQEPVRLPEFGPRKIHSTPEVEPDPLLDEPSGASTQLFNASHGWVITHVSFRASFHASWSGWDDDAVPTSVGVWVSSERTITYLREKPRQRPPSNKPQWDRPFYDRRPTEPVKVGRPKRRRSGVEDS